MPKPIPGPDPRPRKPRLKAPPKACDCHNHIFGPSDRYPYKAARQYTPPDAPLEDFLAMLGVLGIERAVIVQPSIYGSDNRCTEDAVTAMRGRARGIATVDPGIPQEELTRLDRAGFRGVRFNLIHTGGSTPLDELEALAEKIAPLDWHVQIYLRGRLLPAIESRLRQLPVEVVIDHMGHMEAAEGLNQPGVASLLRLLEGGRTWVKLCPYRYDHSGYPFNGAKALAQKLAGTRPDRVVWGTDWPHPDIPGGQMPNDGDLLDALGDWFDDDALIRRILVDNPNALYRFDSRPLGS
ncbi:MAG: amidohydrolase family protein [Kiloniellaceae bacterium]